MVRNNIRTALRFLWKNKVFAGINVLGLSLALAVSFIVFMYVINELSYDHCHKNRKRIFRVINHYVDFDMTLAGTPYILSSALKDEFPQIEKSISVGNVNGFRLKLNDEFINVPIAIGTNSDVFNIFTIPLVDSTSNENLLGEQNTLVLSEELATRLFPDQNPIGQEIIGLIENEDHVFTITGVFKDTPENSTFRAQCFLHSKWAIEQLNKNFGISDADKNWTISQWRTWILLSENNSPKSLEDQFLSFEKKYLGEVPSNHYLLQNLADVYLGSDDVGNTGIKGNLDNIRLFFAIALLIVIVASTNYIILATAISSKRIREIGIRKTFGSDIYKIRSQLLSESILLTVLVLPVALVIMWRVLPYASQLFQTQLHLIKSNTIIYVLVYLALTVLIGFASGIYTSFYLSRLNVIRVLNNTIQYGQRKQYFRASLVVFQLVVFCSFVASTLIIRSQYQYALKKDPGHYIKSILLIDLGRDFKGYPAFINSIKSDPNVIQAAGTMHGLPMVGSMSMVIPHFQDKELKVTVEGMAIDFNFLKTMGIQVIQGRDFSEEFGSDLNQSVILNEKAVDKLGITDPLGKVVGGRTVIGVVKDFNLHSIHSDIPPIIISLTDRFIMQVAVHHQQGTLSQILPVLEEEWKTLVPDRPFSYSTLEDRLKDIYASENDLTTIVFISALFTLIIAMFGLFGLTLFITQSRTKEIGIKKVFGSSERSIVFSFLFKNVILVFIAALLSIPVTLYFMTKWLNNFSYKVNMNWWFFALSFLVAAIIVTATVSFHSYKASLANPVNALRYE